MAKLSQEAARSPVVAHAKEPAGHDHHHDPKAHERHYVKIWALLVGLLVVSVIGPLVGELLPPGTARFILVLTTAFGIALVKAYYVVKHFMHLNVEPKYVAYLCATALAFMGLFFFFVAPDVMKHEGRNWENESAQAREIRLAQEHANSTPSDEPFEVGRVFHDDCSSCHGDSGRGNGAAAAALNPRPANFQEPAFWETRDRAHIIKVITEGGLSVGKSPVMAAFGTRYTSEQIEQLADLVMSFRPPEEPRPEPRPRIEPEPEPEVVEVVPPEPTGPSEADQRARAEFIRQRLYQN